MVDPESSCSLAGKVGGLPGELGNVRQLRKAEGGVVLYRKKVGDVLSENDGEKSLHGTQAYARRVG